MKVDEINPHQLNVGHFYPTKKKKKIEVILLLQNKVGPGPGHISSQNK